MNAVVAEFPQTDAEFRASVLAQLAEIRSIITPQPQRAKVLTVEDAMAATGHSSTSAFYRWTAANRVKPCRFGGYLQEHIELGLRMAAARKRK